MDLKMLQDYNNWVGKSPTEILNALKNVGGWKKVFPDKLPMWAMLTAILLLCVAVYSQTDDRKKLAEEHFARARAMIEEADENILNISKWHSLRDAAVVEMDKALELDHDNRKYLIERGRTVNDPADAVADLSRAIELKPDDVEVYIFRAEAEEDNDKAFADYNKAISLQPKNAELYSKRGEFHELNGRFDKALADYNKAVALEPDNLESLKQRASFFTQRKNYAMAIRDYTTIIKNHPDLSRVYLFTEICDSIQKQSPT